MSQIDRQRRARATAFGVALGIFLFVWGAAFVAAVIGDCVDEACSRAKDLAADRTVWTGIVMIVVGVGVEVWRRWMGAFFFCMAAMLLFPLLSIWPR